MVALLREFEVVSVEDPVSATGTGGDQTGVRILREVSGLLILFICML